ncbi:uncharacterized protein [Lolium perenne]|uniref:uncharacterized protein n=1 Tax=Lolium perenne TaxID=4522 RepID=UPI003A996E51
MAATAEAVPDEVRRRWWEAFSHGFAVDQGEYEEPEVDVDAGSDFERVAGNAHTRVDEQSIPAAAAARHCEGEEELPGDGYVQLQGNLLAGTKRKAAATHAEPRTTKAAIQDEKVVCRVTTGFPRYAEGIGEGYIRCPSGRKAAPAGVAAPESGMPTRISPDHQTHHPERLDVLHQTSHQPAHATTVL